MQSNVMRAKRQYVLFTPLKYNVGINCARNVCLPTPAGATTMA
jgi:hypothetical protein